ncbi:hypothetical protein GQ44DRAFT_706710 [Phaeosphaeriaceae sp. PMI808]|nr:hypothetical protein GQ44DRAFT_706710 [Phaeosphaeriaceae sp. PMI808]
MESDAVIQHSLATWSEKFQHSQCQDPRDKVYAFLGLIAPVSRRMIKVNYNKSVSDVFWEARRAEQFAYPRARRWDLDHYLSRALHVEFLLRPKFTVGLTSKPFNLNYIPVYKRSGPTQLQANNRVDSDLESIFANDNIRITGYSNRRVRMRW